MRFSERIGVVDPKPIQIKEIDDSLRNRIWNCFNNLDTFWYKTDYDTADQRASNVLDLLGFLDRGYDENIETIESIILKSDWFIVYDFIEVFIGTLDADEQYEIVNYLNDIFTDEKSAYRIVSISCKEGPRFQVTPIINPTEISSLEKAGTSQYNSVNEHLAKALAFYSDRQNPDYPNSIKESISAVESLCCHLTGNRKATLGQALKKLKSDGWAMHSSLESALNKLYGYASDEDGIRHGGFDSSKADAEDALFMLVSCSAFINYMIEKKRKLDTINNNGLKHEE